MKRELAGQRARSEATEQRSAVERETLKGSLKVSTAGSTGTATQDLSRRRFGGVSPATFAALPLPRRR